MDQRTKNSQLKNLKKELSEVYQLDKYRLSQQLEMLEKKISTSKFFQQELQQLIEKIDASKRIRAKRQVELPAPKINDSLPISRFQNEIIQSIKTNPVTIVVGDTGSGKTTQIPQMCLLAGRGVGGYIGCTQPRRIAALSIASRVAEELEVSHGQQVGYKIRFDDRVTKNAYIKFMTDGILLAEIQQDHYLDQYDTIIIDEAHERSLNIDFLLGYIKRLLPKRPDLRVIITSATIDAEKLSQYFNQAPIIYVEGRTYPVEVWYRDDQQELEIDLAESVYRSIQELSSHDPQGDVLAFFASEREINQTKDYLMKRLPSSTNVLPLYGRLSSAVQNKIFSPGKNRRVILSTNIAETSLTVPRIKFVIDTGLARISRYSQRNQVQRLPIEAISKASAEQRKGRCGRLSDGICIRLFSEESFENRLDFTEPEIKRTSLASVILQMLSLRLGTIEDFDFLDLPETKQISNGYQLLFELGAVDSNRKITRIGKQLVQLPIDLRLGRMLFAARQLHCLQEILVIVSGLSVQDPRERPLELQQKADEAHEKYQHDRSDFIALIKLWNIFQEEQHNLSNNQLRKYCGINFLSYRRMLEWQDIYHQLLGQIKAFKWKINHEAIGFDDLHQAILSGLLNNVGIKEDGNQYLGTKSKKYYLFPGSGLFNKGPKWLMSNTMLETQKVYGLTNAPVKPEWIEPLAGHLIKHHYFEPHWSITQGCVVALRQASLYGLIISQGKSVHYGAIDPAVSREILIQSLLVDNCAELKLPFMLHNQKLVNQVIDYEKRQRCHDLLVSKSAMIDFYDEQLPKSTVTQKAFTNWYNKQVELNPGFLKFKLDQLIVKDVDPIRVQFPDEITFGTLTFKLSYEYELSHINDGVTIYLPLHLLNQVSAVHLSWLVPGLLKEKLLYLIKSLPKRLRRQLVPMNDFLASCFTDGIDYEKDIFVWLNDKIDHFKGLTVEMNDYDLEKIPDYLFFYICLIDEDDKEIATSRNLEKLQANYGDQAQQQFFASASINYHQDNILDWDFDALPKSTQLETGMTVYPALTIHEESVALRAFPAGSVAEFHHLHGAASLIINVLPQQMSYIRKLIKSNSNLSLLLLTKQPEVFLEQFLVGLVKILINDRVGQIRDKDRFMTACSYVAENSVDAATKFIGFLIKAADLYQAIKSIVVDATPYINQDIDKQLSGLFVPNFLLYIDFNQLQHYPRYLQAVIKRVERCKLNPASDNKHYAILQPFVDFLHHCDEYLKPLYLMQHEQDIELYKKIIRYRWLMEEFRVSLFAQQLKTAERVSSKKLQQLVDELKNFI